MSIDLELTEALPEAYDDLGESSNLFATAPPRYTGNQYGSNSGRIISPRGGPVNVRFSDAVLKANQFNAFRAQVQSDMRKVANSIRSMNQSMAAQSSMAMMTPLFSMMMGPPKLKEVKVEEAKDSQGRPTTDLGVDTTIKFKDTSYNMDMTTLMPMFLPMFLSGNQAGSQSNMFGGQNPMFMMFFLFMIMKMSEDKK